MTEKFCWPSMVCLLGTYLVGYFFLAVCLQKAFELVSFGNKTNDMA